MRFTVLRYLSALITLLATGMGVGSSAFAQVSSMNFTQTTGTYTEITGGTVVATASGTSGAASLDDVIYTLGVGTIPFNFTFDNVSYTDLKISTNGFLTFGATAPSATGSTTGYTPISASTAYAGAISPLGRNLNAYFFTGVPAQTGEIRYQTLGTSPNRIFVVQWKNFKTFNTSGTTFGPVLNFQVRLSEGSNAIELVYNCSGAFVSSTAQVGLRGANNLFPSNVNNRSVAAASNTWITSVAGTANNSTCEFSGSLLPPAGLTYRYAPNQCPSPQNLLATNITQTTAELTWTTTGGGGTFTVEYGFSGFTPGAGQVLTGVQSGVTNSGLTDNTAYQFYVTQNCGILGNSPRVGPSSFSSGTPGEDCATALLLNVANSLATCSFTTVTSGVSANGPNAICSDFSGNTPNDDRWYRFVAPTDGSQLVITTTAGTNSDWVMEVWSACPSSGGITLKCADDVNVGMPEIRMCQNEYNAGQTYYVRLWTYSTFATGTANLCVYKTLECPIPPVNDECLSAIALPVNAPLSCPGLSQTFSTLYATPNIDAATCDAGTKRDVWFSFNTGNHPGFKLTISPLTATTLKAQVLFECGGFELNCYSPANGAYTFSGLNPQADYVIRVWSDTGTAGTFNICLESTGCPAPTATWGANQTICSGQTAVLPVNFTGTAPWTFSYRNNTTNQVFNITTSANPYNLSLSPVSTTSYSLVSVSDANCAGTATGTATVTVATSLPAPVLSGPSTVCRNATGQVFSTTAQSGVTYSWTVPTGVTITSGQGTNSITTTWGSSSVSGNVTLSISSSCGSNTGSLAVTVVNAPTTPTVSGSGTVCSGQSNLSYSVASQTGVTYSWSVPTGVSIASGQGTNSITTNWSASAVSGSVVCQISNSCGTVSGSLSVTVNSAPSTPTVVGTTSLCTGQTGVGYSVTAQAGVTYSWTVPTGVTISSGQSTNAITTSWSASAVSGNVSCVLTNSCGSVTGTLAVSVGSAPTTPTITGNASVCPNQTGVVYSITAQAGVTYTWTAPTGVTITAGQGTNSITTTWGASAVSGNVGVTITNACGSANDVQAVVVSSTPSAPVVSGPSTVCRNATGQVYSTTAQSGVTYSWTVPTGVTITAGQGTNSITTSWGSTSVSGNVTLSITSSCGSNSGSLAVTVTSAPTAATVSGSQSVCTGQTGVGYSVTAQTGVTYNWTVPTGVTITAGQGTSSITTTWSASAVSGNVSCVLTNSCGSVTGTLAVSVGSAPTTPTITGNASVCPNQTGVVYSITAQAGVTYTWTAPTGVTITAGQGTSSITTTWGASAVSGNVGVTITNACGSANDVQAVVVSSTPSAPVVSGPSSVCRNATGQVYSTTAQSGVTYNWTAPTGVTITSGQGTNSITTSWGSTSVSGNVTLSITSSCGSNSGSLAVTVTSAPTTPTVSGASSVCRGQSSVGYSVTAQAGVTYSWTVPTGVTISSGQGTNSITTSWSASAVSGNVSCVLTNSCGSVTGTLAVTVGTAPTTPSITGNASVCPNQTGVVYSTTAQTGVTYSWTVPSGVTITAGLGTNSITTTWGASAVSGNVVLTVTNSCGSANATQAVTVSTTPAAPVVSGPASVCRNATGQVYSTTAQSGVTYTWTVPTGVTITSGQGTNSITTSWGSTSVSGNVTLSITSSCGSNSGSLAVTVTSAPTAATVSGASSVCRGQTNVGFSVTAQTGVTYSWSVPAGVTINSGQGTASIVTTWGSSAVTGNVTCTITNSCGSVSGSRSVTVNAAPTTPVITGSTSLCANQSGVVYSVTAQAGVTYSWTIPAGVTITSGQGTNSITTTWGATSVSGNVSVSLGNSCGSSNGSLSVTVTSTLSIGLITGSSSVVVPQSGVVYSVSSQSGVTFNWTVPAGVTITSGQGTNSITTSWSTSAVSGNVSVTGTGACGSSTANLAVTVSSGGTFVLEAISGPTPICRPSTGVVYSVNPRPGVSYSWSVPSGVIITSGQGTSSITTDWVVPALSGNVTCFQSSGSGSGTASFFVTLRVSLPGSAGNINGSSSACRGDSLLYFVRPISTADFYIWTPGAGMTINGSSGPVTTPDTAVYVRFTSTFTGDSLRVNTGNCKGVGTAPRSLFVSRTFNAPATPPAISGQNNALCGPSTFTYTIGAGVANALSYTWRTTIAGVLINGLPSPATVPQTATTVTVTYPAGFSTTGTLYVRANNTCGISAERSLSLKAKPNPATAILGKDTVCRNTTEIYSVTPRQGVTTWTWTKPNSVAIVSGQGTSQVALAFNNTTGNRTIKVTATNACGSSTAKSKTVLAIACNRLELSDVSNFNLDVYPNPANDFLLLNFEVLSDQQMQMSVFDLAGRMVNHQGIEALTGFNSYRMDAGALQPGMYLITLQGKEGSAQVRVMVER